MCRKLICLISFVLVLAIGSMAQAGLFDPPLDEPSFESPVLDGWGYYSDGWILGSEGSAYIENGAWFPSSDGINVWKLFSGANLWQQIGTWDPGIDYVISLWVGRALTDSTLSVELWAGGNPSLYPTGYYGQIEDTVGATLIAEADLIPTVEVGQSEWMTAILNTGTGFNAGDALWLRILTPGGEYTYVDLVEVSALLDPALAYSPSPPHEATDVSRDVVLSWTPGEFAAAVNGHTVFFSENFDNVNDGVDGITQSASSYDPGRLKFETLYYWRVDEVNAPPDSTVFPGEIWSFTVESLAYPIPSESITATASSQASDDEGPENTIDSSGLDPNDLHSFDPKAMWISEASDPGSASIQYEFDKSYKLHEMLVWNYNGNSLLTLYGLKEVTIEYSIDGTNWSQLENISEFAQAIGDEGYAANTTVAFNGAAAKYVKITANSNWGGGDGFFNQYGLSEIQFLAIPL
ncbi:MAG: discoidin domain-containing protein, partial [Deltaproteobacteria bacterium]|nr:discoidin domain-containing protein [Deltaproteobacteria bacterium]